MWTGPTTCNNKIQYSWYQDVWKALTELFFYMLIVPRFLLGFYWKATGWQKRHVRYNKSFFLVSLPVKVSAQIIGQFFMSETYYKATTVCFLDLFPSKDRMCKLLCLWGWRNALKNPQIKARAAQCSAALLWISEFVGQTSNTWQLGCH